MTDVTRVRLKKRPDTYNDAIRTVLRRMLKLKKTTAIDIDQEHYTTKTGRRGLKITATVNGRRFAVRQAMAHERPPDLKLAFVFTELSA